MAYRDRRQGFAFIYENPLKLLKQLENSNPQQTSVRIERPDFLPMGVLEAEKTKAMEEAIRRLQRNLERLQGLQAKIRFMLAELEKTTEPRRKN